MGERYTGSVEVMGSNPTVSITRPRSSEWVLRFFIISIIIFRFLVFINRHKKYAGSIDLKTLRTDYHESILPVLQDP